GSRSVSRAAAELQAALVHVSTDVVHDGRRAPYADDARPTPLFPYARSKAEAEDAVLAEHPRAAIVRTSLIYGLHTMDRGTADFAARLARSETLRLFTDVVRQPVWVETLAQGLLRLAERRCSGFFNLAGSQALTREAFARRLLDHWQVPGRERYEPIRAADLSGRIPLDLRLELHRARRTLDMELPGVDQVLARARGGSTPVDDRGVDDRGAGD
ncbi:MAG: sugar nucleotide-binding protein, partial [Holophagales bacterium]|nr:sugar nucleotide-binding protein [Holophagales bacterium]